MSFSCNSKPRLAILCAQMAKSADWVYLSPCHVGGFLLAGKEYFSNLLQGIAKSLGQKEESEEWLPVPSIVQSERRGERRGQACQHWLFFLLWSSSGNCQLGAWPNPSHPTSPIPSLLHTGHQSSRKGTFFQSANRIGKMLATLTFMGMFSARLRAHRISLVRSLV